MTKEKSFMDALIKLMKKNPVLREKNETVVKIKVSSIINIGQQFHDEGYKNDDSIFGQIFGK